MLADEEVSDIWNAALVREHLRFDGLGLHLELLFGGRMLRLQLLRSSLSSAPCFAVAALLGPLPALCWRSPISQVMLHRLLGQVPIH